MKSHVELIHDFNAAGVNFLMTELDVAYSFANVAMGPYSFDRKHRLLNGAKRALHQALSMHPRFRLSEEEEKKFQRISASVEKTLAGFALEADSSAPHESAQR
jgi:hypothetical protein